MIIDKNGNELQAGDVVRFVALQYCSYEFGIIKIIDESGSLYIKYIGPLQHATRLP